MLFNKSLGAKGHPEKWCRYGGTETQGIKRGTLPYGGPTAGLQLSYG